MFKRVEKRRRKKIEEEELGLDEDMKEILGMHDTDSDETDSDSDESSTEDVEEKEKYFSDMGGLGKDSENDEEEEEDIITIQEALRDPVYLISLQPDIKACVVCPGKLLKGGKMVELHRTSKAHERRFKQFKTVAAQCNWKENALDVVRQQNEGQSKPSLTPSENSKRAEKRRGKQAANRDKRAQQKVKLQKAATSTTKPDGTDVSSAHAKEPEPLVTLKKRRIDKSAPPSLALPNLDVPASSNSKTNDLTHSAIQTIVRSTSERAKQARTRFLTSSQHPPRHKKSSE